MAFDFQHWCWWKITFYIQGFSVQWYARWFKFLIWDKNHKIRWFCFINDKARVKVLYFSFLTHNGIIIFIDKCTPYLPVTLTNSTSTPDATAHSCNRAVHAGIVVIGSVISGSRWSSLEALGLPLLPIVAVLYCLKCGAGMRALLPLPT